MAAPRFFKANIATGQVESHGRKYRKLTEVEATRSGVNGLICTAPPSEPGSRERWTLAHEASCMTVLRGLYTTDLGEARRVARRLDQLYRWDLPVEKIAGKVQWEQIQRVLDRDKWHEVGGAQ